jgi:hypothetical protein
MRIGGHGLLLEPAAATRMMVTGDRELVVLRGNREIARITPGELPASGQAVWFASGIARFGDDGPTLELSDGVELESVFTSIETGLLGVEWSALAGGMSVDLPVDVEAVPASPGDDDPYFELHVPNGNDEFISFMPRAVKADDVVIKPAPYQRLVKTGITEDEIPYTECAYEHDGKQWRQIFYAVPLANDETVVVRAQASEPHADLLFQAAQVAATSLVPLR